MSHTSKGVYIATESYPLGEHARFCLTVRSDRYRHQSLKIFADIPLNDRPNQGDVFLLRADTGFDETGSFRIKAPPSTPTNRAVSILGIECKDIARRPPTFCFAGLCRNAMRTGLTSYVMEMQLIGRFTATIL